MMKYGVNVSRMVSACQVSQQRASVSVPVIDALLLNGVQFSLQHFHSTASLASVVCIHLSSESLITVVFLAHDTARVHVRSLYEQRQNLLRFGRNILLSTTGRSETVTHWNWSKKKSRINNYSYWKTWHELKIEDWKLKTVETLASALLSDANVFSVIWGT